MTKKKVKKISNPVPEYTFITVDIREFNANIGASINYEVRNPLHCRDNANIYNFSTHLELEGICTYPENRVGEHYNLTIYGSCPRHLDFGLTLTDCHVRDDNGMLKYRKVRGKEIPIYDIPKGIGHLKRKRGMKSCSGWTWLINTQYQIC